MIDPTLSAEIKRRIRTVRGWPKPGVNFRDVATLFQDRDGLRLVVDGLAELTAGYRVDLVAAVDARGFILGGALAYRLGLPFSMVRKKGKLPHITVSADYELEYGSATIEVHADACAPGQRVLLVDDLIATGGTLLAAVKLFRGLGGEIAAIAAVIDLPELGGSRRLRETGAPVHALCEFIESE
ncbi:MAG: adenine phosphoribosyltransferase [Opitutaceae bacterium]|nr:adenine phosphoribosyltransferase [Opitutaceae bacterium]